ncbi:hypothetical protein N1030_09470 [Desulfovibrio mangrovi]|uniref:hypothetical protein n=1 Tax=Desulfovibrio mangrovi TaxID=2976983 RepID=UPI0022468736|nr:hypothetical protein [Desulfovibrio mangrovi]UZP65858.1 hypothetical protein N1030_09470 [Desulfovibrio mangrovi]
MSKNIKIRVAVCVAIIVISLVSALAEYVSFYQQLPTGDRTIYMTLFEHSNDPSLWSNDPMFTHQQDAKFSLYPVYGRIAQFFRDISGTLQMQVTLMQFIFTALFLFSAYFLVGTFTRAPFISFIVALFFTQYIRTVDSVLMCVGFPSSWWSRSAIMPLILLCYAMLYKCAQKDSRLEKYAVPLTVVSLCSLLHPPTAVGFLVIFFILPLIISKRYTVKQVAIYTVLPLVAISHMVAFVDTTPVGDFTPEQYSEYMEGFRERYRTDGFTVDYPFNISLTRSKSNILSGDKQLMLAVPFIVFVLYFNYHIRKGRQSKSLFVVSYSLVTVLLFLLLGNRFEFSTFIVLLCTPVVYSLMRISRQDPWQREDCFILNSFFLAFICSVLAFFTNEVINSYLVTNRIGFPIFLISPKITGYILLPCIPLIGLLLKEVALSFSEMNSQHVKLSLFFVASLIIIAMLGLGKIPILLMGSAFVLIFRYANVYKVTFNTFLVLVTVLVFTTVLLKSWKLDKRLVNPLFVDKNVAYLSEYDWRYKYAGLINWALSSTSKDDLLFVDPNLKLKSFHVRLLTHRGVVHGDKIGGWAGFNNKKTFINWWKVERKLNNVTESTYCDFLLYVRDNLNARYFLTTAEFARSQQFAYAVVDDGVVVVDLSHFMCSGDVSE